MGSHSYPFLLNVMPETKMKSLIGFVFFPLLLLPSQTLFGQIQLHDRNPYMTEGEFSALQQQITSLREQKNREGFDLQEAEVFKIKDAYYLCPDGTFEVYRFDGNSLINISQSRHFGYNHASYKFVYKGVIYSLGGYGYWRSHADLIAFDMKNGKWDMVPVKGEKPPGITAASTFVTGNSIITFNAYRLDQSVQDLRTKLDDVFKLDMKHKRWKANGELNVSIADINPVYMEGESFTFNPITPQTILDKQSGLVKIDNTTMLDISGNTLTQMFYHIKGDSVTIYNDQDIYLDLDLKQLFDETDVLALNLIRSNNKYGYLAIGGSTLLLILIFTAFYRRTYQKDPANKEHNLIKKLLDSGQQSFSLEGIDKLFELEDIMSNETRRYKRATLINQVNDSYKQIYGNELITRIKDPDDKRRFIYLVKS